ncbi:MAG: DUF1624 domain-containing protein [Clostridia bacterium]|nr:DUF1624 domain-containing protein [Clostridia bacterium]
MPGLLKKEEINTSRQYSLDLLKALAIVSMIICHCVIMLGVHHDGYENDFLYRFGDVILGDYVAVAHAFMFAMGVGTVFTDKNRPADLVKRGIKLFVLGYILNLCRYGIYALLYGLISGEFEPQTLEAVFGPDILQFAGLAMILTGAFRRLRLNAFCIFLIGIAMSAAGSLLVLRDTGEYVSNLLLGHLITTTRETSCFALLNWYVFPASGILFGEIIRRIRDLNGFYRKLFIVSALLSAVYIALTVKYGTVFLTRRRFYYGISTLEAAGLLCTDLCLLSAFHYLVERFGPGKFKTCIEMSRNLTPIYFIQWCIIGFVDSIFCYVLEISFPYYVIYPFGIALIIGSFYLARAWNKLKRRRMLRRSA